MTIAKKPGASLVEGLRVRKMFALPEEGLMQPKNQSDVTTPPLRKDVLNSVKAVPALRAWSNVMLPYIA